ncbi:hypothetical protein [Texcoconibacillus texcoconensis]|nr:hypothetical protein [Texcoconibacillus texcoconensis]
MGHPDPHLMRLFYCKICNPVCAVKVYKVLNSCTYQQLCTPEGAYWVVDQLAHCCGVKLTKEQRDYGAHYLMTCGVDPHNPRHRSRMWGLLSSYQ